MLGQSAGYQNPTAAIRLVRKGDQWTTESVWENSGVSLYMSNGVLVGDTLFGLSHRNRGQYFLIDTKSGKTIWTGMPRAAEKPRSSAPATSSFRSRMMRSSHLIPDS